MKRFELVFCTVFLSLLILPELFSAQITPPFQNYVLRFSDNDVAVAPQSNLLNLGNQFTIETWVYLNGQQSPFVVIMGKVHSQRNNDPFMHYVLDITPDGKLEFVQTTGQPGSYRSISSPSALSQNQWVHVAATLQGTEMRLFINGQQVATGNSPGSPTGADAPFTLGGGVQGFGGQFCCGFNGYLRQSRVWNRALSSTEILNNASRRVNIGESGLVAQWMLDEGTGQTAQDSSANNLSLQFGTTLNSDNNDPQWIRTSIVDQGPFFTAETFQIPPTEYASHGRLLDLDTDGDLDFIDVRTNFTLNPGPVMALRNNGSGVFSNATSTIMENQSIPVIHPRHYAVADFNNDGRKDFFIADHGFDSAPFSGGQSRILMQTADGRMIDETTSRIPVKNAFTHYVSAADIEGDGDIDLFLANIGCGCPQKSPELYINDGTGRFTANTSRLPAFLITLQRKYTSATFVDLNGDNRPELVLGAHPGTNPDEGGLRDTILLNNGTGNFTVANENVLPPRSGGSTWGTLTIEVADFNSDNHPDLILSIVETNYNSGRVQLLLNNGNGTFRDGSDAIPQIPLSQGGNWIDWSFPADFNNDGKIDFIVSPNGSDPPHLFLNSGQARFVNSTELLPAIKPNSQAFPGDLDGDGDIDIFLASGNGDYTILKNQKPFIFDAKPFDYDGDGQTDISIYRPSLGQWWYLRSSDGGNRAFAFGAPNAKIVPADYTGDGKTDIAYFLPATGEWFIIRSENNTFYGFPFGQATDIPLAADFDGDGRSDPTVYRPSTQTWFTLKSTGGTEIRQFGSAGDLPVVADYDGDRRADLAIFRPGAGEWWILKSTGGNLVYQFGSATDKTVAADYTGDGKTDVAFWRPSTGEWFVIRSENQTFYAAQFGTNGDVPVPGEYDADGKADFAVFRPSTSGWFINKSSGGAMILSFGQAGDTPTANAFVP